ISTSAALTASNLFGCTIASTFVMSSPFSNGWQFDRSISPVQQRRARKSRECSGPEAGSGRCGLKRPDPAGGQEICQSECETTALLIDGLGAESTVSFAI